MAVPGLLTMPRLIRPYIPLLVRCQVALRQSGEMWIINVIVEWKGVRGRGLGELLKIKLAYIALMLGCEVKDLRLDHNPALGAREKVFRKGVHVGYRPDANDPDHLMYREKHAHDVKTRLRGDHGQFSDIALIKRERRRTRKKKLKPKRKWALKRKIPSRPFRRLGYETSR